MRRAMYPFAVFSALLMLMAAGARADSASAGPRHEREIRLQRVLFPPFGYDDNDNVVVRVEGELPDPCYVLGRREVSRDPGSQAWVVRQFAWRRDDDVCKTGDMLGERPFSEDVPLGRMPSGNHQVGFVDEDGKLALRPIQIEAARLNVLDNLHYANVTSVVAPEVSVLGTTVSVEINGIFGSSCNKLREPIDMERVGNVFVIRPVELELGDCGWSLNSFRRPVPLGKLPAGEYLIHVRASGGRAVQKTFWVLKPGAR